MRNLAMMVATVLGGGWENIAAPNAAFSWLPFTVQKMGRSFRPSPAWTINGSAPTGKAYYVTTTGNDADTGLDWAHALRKINTACKKADAKVVYVQSGLYGITNGYANPNIHELSVIASGGRVICGAFFETLAWAADGDAYTSALVSANTYMVIDAATVDAQGDYSLLTLVANSATVKTTPGSWYCDGNNIWVRTTDSRAPDANVRVYDKSKYPAAVGDFDGGGTTNATYYFENFDFEGGYHAFYGNAQATDGNKVYLNNCTFKYSSRNGFANEGETCYLYNCIAARNVQDGFNAHKSGAVLAKQVEINCITRNYAGAASDSNNGCTSHDGNSKVIIMGDYSSTAGPICHDIGVGTTNWYLGTKSHDSTSNTASYKVGFVAGSWAGTESTSTWLDCCQSYGNTGADLRVNDGSTIYLRNFQGSTTNAGTGTVATY